MIFVTGATGLIGSHLLLDLAQKENEILAIKHSEKGIKNVINVFKYYYPDNYKILFDKISWVKGDILDIDFLKKTSKNIKKIYHCAGFISFKKSEKKLMKEINIQGTKNIIDICLTNNIEKLCYVSSIASLGKTQDNEAITEKTSLKIEDKISYYSRTKLEAEMEIWRGIAHGLNAVIVNPSIILGIGDFNNGSLKFFPMINKGLSFYTLGKTGFVDVKDVSKIMIKLMNSNIVNERFIISENNYTYQEIFNFIAKYLNKKIPNKLASSFLLKTAYILDLIKSKIFFSNQKMTRETIISSQNISLYDNEKIRKTLNYSFIPIENTIKLACKYFLKE